MKTLDPVRTGKVWAGSVIMAVLAAASCSPKTDSKLLVETPAPIAEPAGSSFLRPRLVHGKIPTIEVRAIQGLYGFLRFVGIRHFDETETA